jgi:hypothetical protein
LVSADKGYTPLNLSDNIISDIVEPNIPDTIANIKQKSLHGRYFKELEQPEINIQASHAWLKKSNIHHETEGFIFAIQDRVINTRNYKKHICGLQSIIDKCRICGTEGETIEHIISSCTVLAQSEYKKRHDIFATIIHMNLAVKFNLLKDAQCGGETPVIMLISTALLHDSNIRIMNVLRQNCRAAGWWRVKEINSFFVVGHCSIKKMLVIKANSWLCILATLKIRL